jgi:hypothetical protein
MEDAKMQLPSSGFWCLRLDQQTKMHAEDLNVKEAEA